MQKIKKPVSILLAVLMVFSLFAVVPFTASAVTIDDARSLLSSMEAKMNDYYAQGDWDRADALKNYYDWLDEELEYADGEVTPELENAYNAAYEYFMAGGSGVSYPDVNNVYWATNGWVNVTVSDLQPGDVLGSSSDYLSVRKGDCDIVLVGGTYCEGGSLNQTYPNNVTLGNDIEFHFSDNFVRIIDGDNAKNYSPVYNNALGNAYMVIDNDNGTVYLAGYYFTIYTVTWKNEDGTTLETDTDVEEGATPTYDGETPTKADGECCTYTFSGWTDGTNTYAANELPTVAADVTYTATFTSAVNSERAANLVEITDHETELADLGLDYDMSKWGRSMTAQEAITLAQYMSAQNDGAKCAVLYEAVDDYELQYAMSDGTTGSRADFYYSSLNDFLPDYKVYYLPLNLNPETIELNLNRDNASVIWYDATDSDGYWSMEAAYNDGCYLVLKGNSNQPAGTYEWADMRSGCEIIDYEANKKIAFVDGSCTVTVNEDVVTVSGTFTGSDRNTYVVTVTYEAPYYTITDESVNGTVTAGVNGADVTKAKAGKTVLLNVAPADGYQLKSITASAQKTTPEDFSELVALMGDAVFDGDDNYDCGGYTCKVEDGKFVVYNGTTLVAELSESNKTGFNGDSDYVEVNSEDALWAFFVENGEITGIDVSDTNDYYIFCSLSGSKSTGTLQPVQVDLTTVAEGSQYSFTMPAKNVTVKAEFEQAAPAPEAFKVYVKKLTGGTYTIENLTGETTVAQLKEIIADQIDIPATAQRLIFAGKQLEDAKTLAEYNIVEESTIHLVIRGYTVTWKNWNGDVLETDTGVVEGATPSYDGETPTKAEDATNTYTFSGWTDGTDTYSATDTLPAVTGDVTYTATYTATKKLIAGQSITLDGNIGINFYIDPSAAGLTPGSSGTIDAEFAWANNNAGGALVDIKAQNKKVAFTANDYKNEGDRIKVTCYVCAAEMTCGVDATFKLNGKTESKTYSVREYCDSVIKATPAQIDGLFGGTEKYNKLVELVKAMLNYGAMAQTKFKVNTGKLANDGVAFDKGDVDGDMLDTAIAAANGTETADNMNNVATALGAKWFSTSLIYLDDSTLRHYFVKATDAFNPSAYKDNKSNYYYYVEVPGIAAAELDNLQSFTAGSQTFKYSALDFVKGMINSSADGDSKNLAKSLYWYNQAANEYFPAPAPAHVHTTATRQDNVVNATCTTAGSYDEVTYCSECNEVISTNHVDVPATGHTIVSVAEVPATTEATGVKAHYECSVCGKLFTDADGNNETTAEELVIPMLKILDLDKVNADTTVENGYTVIGTLKGDYKISIADGATVTLKDVNITCLSNDKATVNFAGITPLGDATILLEGTNTVKGGYENYPGVFVPVGKTLTIDGTGSLNASSNGYGCGIGGGCEIQAGNIVINSGNIVINGGTIIATGGKYAAGIGSGGNCSCGNITITGGTITANGGENAAGIGSGYDDDATCGNILITGGTVTATGGNSAAGIGSGAFGASCGNITIADTVTQVTATKGATMPSNSIGKGFGGSCGTVTIDGVEYPNGITKSPYIYPTLT